MPIPFLIPAIIAGASALVSGIGSAVQGNKNRKAAQKIQREQASANEEYLRQQNEYNTPRSQMARFQDAGLNPHLIYGQGNPGNQSQPLQYPTREERYNNLGEIAPQALQLANQTSLAQSQVQATNAKTRQIGVLTQLNRLQAAVVASNPLLDTEGFRATIDALKATAESKVANAGMDTLRNEWMQTEGFGDYGRGANLKMGEAMMLRELDLLDQKFKLGEVDGKIKAQVLESKEFQNAILEIQKKFMTEGAMTPQHVYQFIQLLLMKFLSFKSK